MLSTVQAANVIGCSKQHVISLCNAGTLLYEWKAWGRRKVRRIDENSVTAYAEANKDNRRIGREFYGDPNRRAIVSKGYRMLYQPEHPRANCDGYVAEHTLVMEQVLGRPLKQAETVHHVDRDKLNNSPDNLRLYASKAAHMRMHAELRGAFLRAQGDKALEKAIIDLVNTW